MIIDFREKYEKLIINENLFHELYDMKYVSNTIDLINNYIKQHHLSFYIYFDKSCLYDDSVILEFCNTDLNDIVISTERISIDSLLYLVEKEMLLGYININMSTWINEEKIKVNTFISTIDGFDNNTWEFMLDSYNENISIKVRLNYINTMGYSKYNISDRINIKLNYDTSVDKIKAQLAATMENLLESTINYYNDRYYNYRMMRTSKEDN
jgi:hypothetical protein